MLNTGGILALQAKAGNAAVVELIQHSRMTAPDFVVQRALIPAGSPGAGRLPAVEKGSLQALLGNNGFSLLDVRKARGEEIDREQLDDLFKEAKAVDAEVDDFPGREAFNQRARDKRKRALADLYAQLLQVAGDARDEATETYDRNVDKATVDVREARGSAEKVGKFFKKEEQDYIELVHRRYGAHISFVTKAAFAEDVFKQVRSSQHVPPAPGLSANDQIQLNEEKEAINAQLLLWRVVAVNGPGTNANGTWGTSFGGSGPGFQIRRVSDAVWRKLRGWWIRKRNAYVTDSDTSDWALKMWRDPDQYQGLSPVMNYHVNIRH
jgi:hypothetical protein